MQHLGKLIFYKLYLFIAELDKYKGGNNKQEITGRDEDSLLKSVIQIKNGSFEHFQDLFYEDMDAFHEKSLVAKRIEHLFYKKRPKLILITYGINVDTFKI